MNFQGQRTGIKGNIPEHCEDNRKGSGTFEESLYKWYLRNNRELPWRQTADPYRIWISEVILQQTRVNQGIGYYQRFTDRFPTVRHLAEANPDDVMKVWQGLGYYSRARNMHKAAKYIAEELECRFPGTYESLLRLPGVGTYTAAAIASIAFNEPVPAVDGNVSRVLARYFGIKEAVNTSTGNKIVTAIAADLMPEKNPGFHNQALMEFGALQCIPRNPSCPHCPLLYTCYAAKNRETGILPVKTERKKPVNRYFTYWCFEYNNEVYLEKRTGDDIWKDLYQFPLEESPEPHTEEIPGGIDPYIEEGCKITITQVFPVKKHILTHQVIHARLIRAEISNPGCMKNICFPVKKKDLFTFAVPKLVEGFFRDLKINKNK